MTTWKILLTARALPIVGSAAVKLMADAGCEMVTSPLRSPLSSSDLISELEGFDAMLCSPDKFTAAVFASPAAQNLKIVSRWGVGYDSIDVEAASAAGVVIAYVPGVLNDAVADYAFSLLCCAARRIADAQITMRAGSWASSWGHDIAHKTLGIVGCGRIGQAMARRASGFEMKILGYDTVPNPAAEKLGVKFVSLDELLEQSDFVSLHAALTPASKDLIGEAQLRKMKPSAYLINTARGGHVNEAALVRALSEGWIAGAALDAYITEPLPAEHPFRSAPNLLITPHQASCARDTGEKVSLCAAQAIVDLMNGKRPKHVVDEGVFGLGVLRARVN